MPNSKRFGGHCFRRTSATLLSDSRANIQTIKQLGRWRFDLIAPNENIEEKSQTTNQKSSNFVDIQPQPSTSRQTTIDSENTNFEFNLNWEDFEDDFTINDVNQAPISK